MGLADGGAKGGDVKSLHFTNSWHESSGGIRTFYSQLMKYAPEHGHFLRMVVPGETDRMEEVNSHARIYYTRAGRAPFNRAYRMISPRSYLGSGSPIVKILAAERPDLVEICDKYSLPYLGGLLRRGWLCGYAHRPTVTAISCERLDENISAYLVSGRWVQAASPVLLKWLYFALADHHIAISRHTADELETASHGHKVTRGVWMAPMGVDVETFSPELRTRAFGSGGQVEMLYAGRLVPEKNAELLLETLDVLEREHPGERWKLTIAGEGISRGPLEKQAAKFREGAVEFLGHVASRRELARLIANADMFVHPNPREPFGIAPMEAMASGTPLVAPNSGGVTTYADEGNSWLSAAEAGAFAASVWEIARDEPERARRVKEALATIRRYSWSAVAARFFELYRMIHRMRLGEAIGEQTWPPLFYSTDESIL